LPISGLAHFWAQELEEVIERYKREREQEERQFKLEFGSYSDMYSSSSSSSSSDWQYTMKDTLLLPYHFQGMDINALDGLNIQGWGRFKENLHRPTPTGPEDSSELPQPS